MPVDLCWVKWQCMFDISDIHILVLKVSSEGHHVNSGTDEKTALYKHRNVNSCNKNLFSPLLQLADLTSTIYQRFWKSSLDLDSLTMIAWI